MTSRTRVSSPGVLIVLLATITSLGPFTVDTIFPGFDAIAADLSTDPVTVQQTVSLYLLTFAGMSLFHGPLSDAIGRRPVIVGGSLLYAAASAACAVAPSIGWLLAARASQGLVAGAGLIVARTVARDVFEGERAQRAMAHMSMLFGLAPAIAPIVGGWLVTAWGWRGVFWFLTAFGLLLALLSVLLLPETHPVQDRIPLRPGAIVSALWESSRWPGVQRLVAVAAFNFGGLFTYIAAAPIIITDYLGLGPQDFGWLFVPVVAAMITGSWLTGRLAARLRGATFVAIGFGVAVIGGLVAIVADLFVQPALPWVLVGPVCTGLGMALVFPIVTLTLLDLRPSHRGTLSSLQSFASTGFNAIVAGALVPWAGQQPVTLSILAVTFSSLGWLLWVLDRRRRRTEPVVPPDPESYEPLDRM